MIAQYIRFNRNAFTRRRRL